MKRHKLDTRLIAAAPLPPTSTFVQRTMQQINAADTREVFAVNTRETSAPKRSLFMKIKALHGVGLALALVGTAVLLSSVVYAAVRFAPELLNIEKTKDSRGATQYRVPNIEDCHQQHMVQPKAYTIKPDAPAGLTDDDVLKILGKLAAK